MACSGVMACPAAQAVACSSALRACRAGASLRSRVACSDTATGRWRRARRPPRPRPAAGHGLVAPWTAASAAAPPVRPRAAESRRPVSRAMIRLSVSGSAPLPSRPAPGPGRPGGRAPRRWRASRWSPSGDRASEPPCRAPRPPQSSPCSRATSASLTSTSATDDRQPSARNRGRLAANSGSGPRVVAFVQRDLPQRELRHRRRPSDLPRPGRAGGSPRPPPRRGRAPRRARWPRCSRPGRGMQQRVGDQPRLARRAGQGEALLQDRGGLLLLPAPPRCPPQRAECHGQLPPVADLAAQGDALGEQRLRAGPGRSPDPRGRRRCTGPWPARPPERQPPCASARSSHASPSGW